MDFWNVFDEQRETEEREARYFLHEKYKRNFLDLVHTKPKKFIGDVYMPDRDAPDGYLRDQSGGPVPPIDYSSGREIICCPEPIEFISEFKDCMDNLEQCRSVMRELIAGKRTVRNIVFQRVKLDHEPKEGIWFNRTDDGVNLRPGLLDEEMGQPYAVTMGDLTVHGVVVGRTGSGKSVFLNNLIFNMLTEYPPWELDLYLADFKKVELSRYMTNYKTPHLKTCAATGEIRYVMTMLTHLVDCMQARQDLFTRLGIQKISEFRKKYNVVLPRVVLLVDEFQQLFLDATSKESAIISDLLTTIIKLGRATGFHLLFASQEMSGALSGKALANFKIRFALPCDSTVSSDILGNAAAATLERGFVLVNTESGKEEQNKKYKVPFIPDDEEIQPDGTVKESYFYRELRFFADESARFSYEKNKTFYQEDAQEDIEELESILCRSGVFNFKMEQLDRNADRYFEIFTLGSGVVFSDKKYALETFFLERGRNKNVLVLSPDVDDLAYIQKLLAINFRYSTISAGTHRYFDFNPILSAKYQISDDLDVDVYDTPEALDSIYRVYLTRTALLEAAKQDKLVDFINVYFDRMIKELKDGGGVSEVKKVLLTYCSDAAIEDIPAIKETMQQKGRIGYVQPLEYYYQIKNENADWKTLFPPIMVWISGIEYLDALDKGFFTMLRNGMSANMLFLLFSATTDIAGGKKFRECVNGCDYFFISGNVESYYRNCGVQYTKKNRNSIVIDFKIKSLNTERAFKKYKIKATDYEVPSLDFDALL